MCVREDATIKEDDTNMSSMIPCPQCDKTFKTESGLRWHLNNPDGPHAGMSQTAIEEAVKKACQGDSPHRATLQQSDLSTEALERIDDLESRLVGVEGTVAELEAAQKHYLEEAQSHIASLDSRIARSAEETQRAIKGLDTKQTSNETVVRQLTRRLDSLTEKVDSLPKRVDELEKQLLNIIDSHSHEVVTLPNGRKKQKVKRSAVISDITALFSSRV